MTVIGSPESAALPTAARDGSRRGDGVIGHTREPTPAQPTPTNIFRAILTPQTHCLRLPVRQVVLRRGPG